MPAQVDRSAVRADAEKGVAHNGFGTTFLEIHGIVYIALDVTRFKRHMLSGLTTQAVYFTVGRPYSVDGKKPSEFCW